MFDMGFTEMMLIGIVALIVIGPERLPGVARTAGKYFGRLKRFMTSVKADVEQELRADELRQILADQQRELDTIKDSMNVAGKAFEKEVNDVSAAGESLAESLDETPSTSEQSSAADTVEPESTPRKKPKSVAKDQADDVKS
ncbi:MAG: Sec-independent protein translocase protein TatB [Gammaproteobacteria bacterium]|nr:Sec-independent protein translocase protein TatB [Gammaproteobacteria bacterium]